MTSKRLLQTGLLDRLVREIMASQECGAASLPSEGPSCFNLYAPRGNNPWVVCVLVKSAESIVTFITWLSLMRHRRLLEPSVAGFHHWSLCICSPHWSSSPSPSAGSCVTLCSILTSLPLMKARSLLLLLLLPTYCSSSSAQRPDQLWQLLLHR